jgi:hypothetical protein
MAGIFPPQAEGGVPPSTPGVVNAYTPVNTVIGEGPLYADQACNTNLTDDQMNGLTSEILAAVDICGTEYSMTYNSNKLTNLGEVMEYRLTHIDGGEYT